MSFGDSADGSPGFGAAVAIAAIAVAGVVARVRSGGE
ncbi:PGF-CTERM sorting domain-containing protein [Natronorubrum sp. FCH18a]